jgi:hypothetical protein
VGGEQAKVHREQVRLDCEKKWLDSEFLEVLEAEG